MALAANSRNRFSQAGRVRAFHVLGKSADTFLIVLLLLHPTGTALVIAAGLAQIGEFSFILAELGIGLHLLPGHAQSLIVAGALISIALNSFLLRAARAIQSRLESAAVAPESRQDSPAG